MLTTFSHLFHTPVTIQYPEEQMAMPPWTRGRPRLIYNLDSGDLRCVACNACAIACPVDVIKIDQHPGPDRKKVMDRFDIDMGGCIECALCVEACPFDALVMAPDFEMAYYDRASSLVFNMYELRIAGTPEVDEAMAHIIGVKRGLTRTSGDTAKTVGAASGARAGTAASAQAAARAGAAAVRAPAQPAGQPQPTAPSERPAAVQIDSKELEGLSPAERAKLYKERQRAAGVGGPPPARGPAASEPAADPVGRASLPARAGTEARATGAAPAQPTAAPPTVPPGQGTGYLGLDPSQLEGLTPTERAALYKQRQREMGIGGAPKKEE